MLKLLLVDDIPDNRHLIRRYLGGEHCFHEAENGLEALNAYKKAAKDNAPYNAIFLDIQMPVMDGLTFLRTIRDEEKTNNLKFEDTTPIIVLTANDGYRETCKHLNADDVLIKPYDPSRLISTLQTSLAARNKTLPNI